MLSRMEREHPPQPTRRGPPCPAAARAAPEGKSPSPGLPRINVPGGCEGRITRVRGHAREPAAIAGAGGAAPLCRGALPGVTRRTMPPAGTASVEPRSFALRRFVAIPVRHKALREPPRSQKQRLPGEAVVRPEPRIALKAAGCVCAAGRSAQSGKSNFILASSSRGGGRRQPGKAALPP